MIQIYKLVGFLLKWFLCASTNNEVPAHTTGFTIKGAFYDSHFENYLVGPHLGMCHKCLMQTQLFLHPEKQTNKHTTDQNYWRH